MKVDNEIKNMAVAMFHSYCNQLATLVNDQLFDGCRDWSWIGDEVGGMCDFEESDVLSPEDMVRILKHNISYDDYAAWREANLDHEKYINLKSWLMGLRHDMLDEENTEEKDNT